VKLAFIAAEKAQFPIAVLCEVLGVSRSGLYASAKRPECRRKREDRALLLHIRDAHIVAGRRTYGSPRVRLELRDRGVCIGRRRAARLMRQDGLKARALRRFVTTTVVDPGLPVAANVLQREFSPMRPNETWAGDITYIRTLRGWLYLAIVMDLYSRRIVGWATSARPDSALTIRALTMAIQRRRPAPGLIFHSDRGCQYASWEYQRLLRGSGVVCSMSRKGNCWDNAVVESFFGTLKTELVHRMAFLDRESAHLAVCDYIERFYNSNRRHSRLGYRSPARFEAEFSTPKQAA
jgi:transposase InsO family protein